MKLLNKENILDVLPKINLLLTFSVIVLVIYLILNLLRPQQASLRFRGSFDLMENKLTTHSKDIPIFQEGLFRRRALFNALTETSSKPKEAEFELLGLVSMGEKTAAMIRDTVEGKDYYCLGGEQIGKFKVKLILKDKVILESKNQTLELSR